MVSTFGQSPSLLGVLPIEPAFPIVYDILFARELASVPGGA